MARFKKVGRCKERIVPVQRGKYQLVVFELFHVLNEVGKRLDCLTEFSLAKEPRSAVGFQTWHFT